MQGKTKPKRVDRITRNAFKAWDRVEALDVEMGQYAYHTYQGTMRAYARAYGMGLVPTVEAFVALSPNSDYHGNLRSLATCMLAVQSGITDPALVTVSTYNACRDRAMSYLTGEVSFLDTVKGRKITAFRHNILYPDTSREVTVDGHMIADLSGKRDMVMKEANFELRVHGYEPYQNAIRSVARKAGLPVPATQAILWTARKRQLGIRFSTQLNLDGSNPWTRVLTPADYPPYDLQKKALDVTACKA